MPDGPAVGRIIGTECFIGLVLIRERRGCAREEEVGNAALCCGRGLLLCDTEPDMAANGAAFLTPV
jgi:hypothetical protein